MSELLRTSLHRPPPPVTRCSSPGPGSTRLRYARYAQCASRSLTRYTSYTRYARYARRLHETPAGIHAQKNPPRSGHDPFRRRFITYITTQPEARRRLDDIIRRFVATRVRAALGARWEHYVYQVEPSMRVHLAGCRALGIRHSDSDYYHQPNEINMWIPLVERVWGSNSLYCESSPGAADFAPFEATRGQFVRFYGNQAVHYTVTNTTDVTRVSFDLRLVPKPLFCAR